MTFISDNITTGVYFTVCLCYTVLRLGGPVQLRGGEPGFIDMMSLVNFQTLHWVQ